MGTMFDHGVGVTDKHTEGLYRDIKKILYHLTYYLISFLLTEVQETRLGSTSDDIKNF